MPLVYENHPGKSGEDAIGSPGVAGGGSGQNPARWRPGSVGRGGEDVKELTHDRFVGLVGGEGWPAGLIAAQPGGGAALCSSRRPPMAPAECRAGAARRARHRAVDPFIGDARHVRDRTTRGWARVAQYGVAGAARRDTASQATRGAEPRGARPRVA
jgi:hypothetical protein